MKPRDYQIEAFNAVCRELRVHRSTAVEHATGLGKTVLMGMAAEKATGRVLILAERRDLVTQTADRFESVLGRRPAIEMAEHASDESGLLSRAKEVVASVQTLRNRLEKFDPADFTLVLVDEAHHAKAQSYRRVVDHFTKGDRCKVFGVSATLKEGMGKVFESIAHRFPLVPATRAGWLVEAMPEHAPVDAIHMEDVPLRGDDFAPDALAAQWEREKPLQQIIKPSVEFTKGRQTVMYCPSVAAAQLACDIWNSYEPGAARWLSGEYPAKHLRPDLYNAFERGEFRVLINCMVLTEGWDAPHVSAIVMGRPTRSKGLAQQMLGRGTRPLKGVVDGENLDTPEKRIASIKASAKPDLLVVDPHYNTADLGIVSIIDILADDESEPVQQRARKLMEKAGSGARGLDVLEQARREIEEEERQAAEARQRRIAARVEWRSERRSILDDFGLRARPWRSGEGRQISDGMKRTLERNKIDWQTLTYPEAAQLCGEIWRRWKQKLCSIRQAKYLKQFGHSTEVSFEEASAILDREFGNRKRQEVAA